MGDIVRVQFGARITRHPKASVDRVRTKGFVVLATYAVKTGLIYFQRR